MKMTLGKTACCCVLVFMLIAIIYLLYALAIVGGLWFLMEVFNLGC